MDTNVNCSALPYFTAWERLNALLVNKHIQKKWTCGYYIWRRHHYRWRAANFDLCSVLMDIEQYHAYSDTGQSFMMAIRVEDHWHSHLLPFGSGADTTYLNHYMSMGRQRLPTNWKRVFSVTWLTMKLKCMGSLILI